VTTRAARKEARGYECAYQGDSGGDETGETGDRMSGQDGSDPACHKHHHDNKCVALAAFGDLDRRTVLESLS
jgi:hypothetical protein